MELLAYKLDSYLFFDTFDFFNDYLCLSLEFYLVYVLIHTIFLFLFVDFSPEEVLIQVGKFFLVGIFMSFGLQYETGYGVVSLFNGKMLMDPFNSFITFLVLVMIFLVVTAYIWYIRNDNLIGMEYVLFLMFVVIGLLVILKANHFALLFLSIELQSLSAYVLAGYKRNSYNSIEAGLKYFLLGAFSSTILLFGIVFLYASTGELFYGGLENLFVGNSRYFLLAFGLLFLFFGLFFKIGVVPFHMWVPDVYAGVSWVTLLVFATVPKLIIYLIIAKFLSMFSMFKMDSFTILFVLSALFSVFIGVLGALSQNDMKRFIGYSAIVNMGYVLVSFLTNNFIGIRTSILYLILYNLQNFTFIAVCIGLRNVISSKMFRAVSLFDGLYKTNKVLAINVTIILFSFIGLPPLSGFFAKFYIFISLLEEKYYFFVILFIFLNGMAAVYYLMLVKKVLFNNSNNWVVYENMSESIARVIVYGTMLQFFYIFYDKLLVEYIEVNLLYYFFYINNNIIV